MLMTNFSTKVGGARGRVLGSLTALQKGNYEKLKVNLSFIAFVMNKFS